MTEFNIGALTGSTSYTGSVDTTNIFDLYKFNINSPGSFKLSIDGLSGNADVFLLNNSGATLYSSTNAGNAAETISADSLVAGDYTLKVLQITGDIKYTLNLAPTSTQKASDADTLIGAKSETISPSNTTILPVTSTSEKPTATKDPITGNIVEEKPATATNNSQVSTADQVATTDRPVTTNAEETQKENSTTTIPTNDTKKEPEPVTDKNLISPFTSGIFTADETGLIKIDYILDGGLFKGELAVFSLEGLEKFETGSEAFIKEVASRSLSNSVKGHVVINDITEGARFSGNLPDGNFNEGVHLGVKSFAVTAGGKYGVMLVPNGTVKFVYDNPTFGGDKRPLFSMVTANPVEGFHLGQIADITGEGNTFAIEDMRFDLGTDKDYNDIIFQVRGATGSAPKLDELIAPGKDWRGSDLGKEVISYITPAC
jgi:hypothetical protein